MEDRPQIAVLIPCHNEQATIAKVVNDFRAQLPDAVIYVFDNCCTDDTAAIAAGRGAIVIKEPRLGKGNVVEAMMDEVQADFFVMVDGDDTYPADAVGQLLKPVLNNDADMAVGTRLGTPAGNSFRPLHVAGNGLVRWLINKIFRTNLTDIMSGYRAFNRTVVRRIPVVSSGFEVETELTIQMLYYHLGIVEVPVAYRGRPAGSVSKLSTFRDGSRVLWKIFSLARAFKPLTFFGCLGLILFFFGVLAGIPPIYGYIQTQTVERFPLAILATGLMILSAGSVFMGVLLHAINLRFKELHNVMTRGKDHLPASRQRGQQ
jgi:glycosyltransferase involved in cell wall biosynthesis